MSVDLEPDAVRHDPTWMHATPYGRWCVCSCGWRSHNGTISFAQDEFGKHLLAEKATP